MPSKTLAVEDVTVLYGPESARSTAVDRVTLEFERGTLNLVMGPSGSGKTTLLSVLGALLRPDRGKVIIENEDISSYSDEQLTDLRRSKIGFVFQAFRLFHSLSAVENVLMAKDVRGARQEKDKGEASAILRDLGLESKLGLKPKELSGGEKQRVAIARALLGNPKVLLADEPTASLDSRSGRQICEIVRNLSDERHYTTVVVSHDPRWSEFADRIVTLEDGRVAEGKDLRKR